MSGGDEDHGKRERRTARQQHRELLVSRDH